jgi:hypothetical protein
VHVIVRMPRQPCPLPGWSFSSSAK